MTTTLNPDYLREITEQVWTSFLDPDGTTPLHAGAVESTVDAEEATESRLAAAVSVTGAWRGHVVVACSPAASHHVAAVLLGIPAGEVTAADVTDALGELANVIGGNVKACLPESCALSLPYVIPMAGARWPSVTEICRLDGNWRDEPVAISVLESTVETRSGRPV
jgi:chemotaxis protein CheX